MFAGLKVLDMTVQDVFMNPSGLKYKCRFIPGHVEKGEKGKHFSYPDYFTYPVIGTRCPDNRGCTVCQLVCCHRFYFECSDFSVAPVVMK